MRKLNPFIGTSFVGFISTLPATCWAFYRHLNWFIRLINILKSIVVEIRTTNEGPPTKLRLLKPNDFSHSFSSALGPYSVHLRLLHFPRPPHVNRFNIPWPLEGAGSTTKLSPHKLKGNRLVAAAFGFGSNNLKGPINRCVSRVSFAVSACVGFCLCVCGSTTWPRARSQLQQQLQLQEALAFTCVPSQMARNKTGIIQ